MRGKVCFSALTVDLFAEFRAKTAYNWYTTVDNYVTQKHAGEDGICRLLLSSNFLFKRKVLYKEYNDHDI
jgi:hypothetical protein